LHRSWTKLHDKEIELIQEKTSTITQDEFRYGGIFVQNLKIYLEYLVASNEEISAELMKRPDAVAVHETMKTIFVM